MNSLIFFNLDSEFSLTNEVYIRVWKKSQPMENILWKKDDFLFWLYLYIY